MQNGSRARPFLTVAAAAVLSVCLVAACSSSSASPGAGPTAGATSSAGPTAGATPTTTRTPTAAERAAAADTLNHVCKGHAKWSNGALTGTATSVAQGFVTNVGVLSDADCSIAMFRLSDPAAGFKVRYVDSLASQDGKLRLGRLQHSRILEVQIQSPLAPQPQRVLQWQGLGVMVWNMGTLNGMSSFAVIVPSATKVGFVAGLVTYAKPTPTAYLAVAYNASLYRLSSQRPRNRPYNIRLYHPIYMGTRAGTDGFLFVQSEH